MKSDSSVYVVVGEVVYEGNTIYGVYDNENLAVKAMKKLSSKVFDDYLRLIKFPRVNQLFLDTASSIFPGKVVKTIAVKEWIDE